MSISFDLIPAALRTPGSYIEFNNELAGSVTVMHKIVAFGQRLSSGSVAASVPTRVTDPSQAVSFFGRGSMLAVTLAMMLAANPDTELWAVALDDDGAGVEAAGSISIDTDATAAGTLAFYIGGNRVRLGVAATDSKSTIATNLTAAINADLDLPLTALINADGFTVDLTCRWKGETGNDIDLRLNYYDGEALPAGVTATLTAMSGGTANPDISPALDALGDDWYNWIVNPYTDSANLTVLEDELTSRWGPTRQIGARAFTAYRGSHAATGTYGSGRNGEHVTTMGTGMAPQPPYLWAGVNAAIAARSLAIDPARPLQTLELVGILAPERTDRLSREERNLLLFDGISTYTVTRDGTVQIERQITTYQTNAAGLADASYLDICTPETLERIRFEQRLMIAQKYPRHKLASDGTNYGAGQAIVTPKIIKGELLALYAQMELKGWGEDYEGYAANLIVERDAEDRNRLNWRDTPNLVNQARTFAGKQQFIV